MATNTRAVCRGISRQTAEWIGMAAAAAGGYVAVKGPGIERITPDHYRVLRDDANDPVKWLAENAREELERYHHLEEGGYARIVSAPSHHHADDYILVVPAGGPFSEEGYALPSSLIAELIPDLQAAGYDTESLQ